MTVSRVSQVALEVLDQGNPAERVSQVAIEVLRTRRGFAIDAIVQTHVPFTLDAYVTTGSGTGQWSIDAIVQASFSSSKTLDAIVKARISGSATLDAWVFKTTTQTVTLDALVSKTVTQTATLDAYVVSRRLPRRRIWFNLYNQSPNISPTPDAGWEVVNQVARTKIAKKNTDFGTNGSVAAPSTVAGDDHLRLQAISDALHQQTFAGLVRGQFFVAENLAAQDIRAQVVIRVVSKNGNVVRGTLLAMDTDALSSEWNVIGLQNRQFPRGGAQWMTPVDIHGGDRLVIELGFRKHAGGSASSVTTYWGGNATDDLPEDETTGGTTSDYVGWMEFSSDPFTGRTNDWFMGSAFDIDAIVKAKIFGSLTLDAVVLKTVASSFSLDAYVPGDFVQPTFTIDAYVILVRTGSSTVDAVIRVGRAASLTANAIIESAGAASATLDALVKVRQAASATLDAWVFKTPSQSYTISAVVRLTRSASIALDGIVRVGQSATLALDAYVIVRHVVEATLDGVVQSTRTGGFGLDGIIRVSRTSTATLDGIVLVRQAASLQLDAYVLSVRVRSVALNAIVRIAHDPRTNPVGATVSARGLGTTPTLAHFGATPSLTYLAATATTAGIAAAPSLSYLTAFRWLRFTRTFTISAEVARGFTFDAEVVSV